MAKRAFDIVFSLICLAAAFPILVVAAFLVRLDGGPIFYTASRAGKDKRPISVPKFRSMIVDADKHLDSQGRPTRERVTKVGKLLRRFSLDEFPQMYCVLTGTMSVVGPRPILLSDAESIDPAFNSRFDVKPGITGLAQVSGRNSIPWAKRFELDCQYVSELSFKNDIRILMKTVSVVLLGAGMSMDRNPDQVR